MVVANNSAHVTCTKAFHVRHSSVVMQHMPVGYTLLSACSEYIPFPPVSRSKITEGVDVFMEVCSVGAMPSASGQIGTSEAGQAESAHCHSTLHVDFITDIAVVPYKQQQFIVSASQDGVIKYWK